MSGETGRQSSSEVAHEAEDTRAHLATTLDQLRNNLKPENVMEEVVSNARIGASTIADNLADVAKTYPLSGVLIAAGAAIIMGVMSRRGGRRGLPTRNRASGSPPRPPLLRNPSTFKPAPGRPGGRSSPSLPPPSLIGDGEDGSVADPKSRPLGGVGGLRQQAASVYQSTSSSARDAMQNASRYIPHDRSEVQSKLSSLLQEQPLVLGAIGLAIGAAIGAALPITETEDNLMGSTAHGFRQSAQDLARHEVDGVRAVAGEAIDNVKKSAADHGLSTDNLNDLVKDVGSQAKTAVNKVGSAHDA